MKEKILSILGSIYVFGFSLGLVLGGSWIIAFPKQASICYQKGLGIYNKTTGTTPGIIVVRPPEIILFRAMGFVIAIMGIVLAILYICAIVEERKEKNER